MGFFKDLLKDVVDEATGGSISMWEANRAVEQLQQLQRDTDTFERWFADHSSSYLDLVDSLNHQRYQVNRKIFHSNWFTGKEESAYSLTTDEIQEDGRRKSLIENAIEKQSPGYMEKLFRDYLAETEKSILDSYSAFRTLQNELSYLPVFQKKIVDSIYSSEVDGLLNPSDPEAALTKVSDFVWQIERHKTPAGHAIVLLLLVKQAYCGKKGYGGALKTQIEQALSKAEDFIIDNTYRVHLPENADDQTAEGLLQAGKGFFLNGKPEQAFACYLFAAKGGSAEAQYRVGRCFEMGYGVYKSTEKAVAWYQESAKCDLPVSKYYLASVYRQVLPEDKRDYSKALVLYREAFDGGVAEAAVDIGNLYSQGNGVEKDEAAAFEWYQKGASTGSPNAMYHLYTSYLNGTGVEADGESAGKWFEKCIRFFDAPPEPTTDENPSSVSASELLDESSSISISELLDESSGVSIEEPSDEDPAEAEEPEAEFYGDSLLPGCDSLFGTIALTFYNGSSAVSKSQDKAIDWFRKGAAIGCGYSLDWLSYLYASGRKSDSVQCARRGSEYGSLPCMNKLGLRYYSGTGVDQDRVLANTWFLRAAKNGDVWGQRNIAFEFLSGKIGVPKDIAEARRWFALAAAQGNEESQQKLDELDAQDQEARKKELEKQRKKLEQKKSDLLSQIAGVDEKIQGAQNPREEEAFLNEKADLEKQLADLEDEIAQYQS